MWLNTGMAGYWSQVAGRAARETFHAFKLDSVERAVISFIVGAIGLAVLWSVGDVDASSKGFYAKAATTAAIVLVWPCVFLWKLTRVPP
jgi:hypothetical protein